MKKHRFLSVFLSLVLVLSTVFTGIVFATPGDSNGETTPPATGKTLVSNGDGTYTLSLSVTGKAETTSESNKADVIVVLDRSGSMDESVKGHVANQTGRYGLVNHRYVNLYYLHNGDYRSLENDTYTGTVYYRTWSIWSEYTYTEYTGTRYEYMNTDRLAVAKSAISALADQLGSYNEENPDAVRFALVTFANAAKTETFSQNSNWTTNVTTFKNKVNSDTIMATGGTNWEDALQKANGLSVREGAEVYVIFVSDGNPTFYVGGGSGQETSNNVSNCYDKAKDDAKAVVNAGKNFYGIGVFGSVDRMKNLVTDAGAPSGNYYSATDSASLQVAFADIISQITNALGYKEVKIEDGLTSMTSALVKTDPTSFTYMRSGGSYGDGATWTPDDAQKAKYEGGKVSWDLGNAQLENGVTYTVSFKVWPSQEAYDIVADLNNKIKDYKDLTADQKAQIVELEGGGYGFKTNTNAKITYTQVETRTTATAPKGFKEGQPADDGYTYTYDSETGTYIGTKETQGSADLSNPNPMVLTSSMITIEKTWDDDFLGDNVRPVSPITLNIKKDGAHYKSLELKKDNDWKANVYVAPGVIVNGETLETGHSYAIEEANTDVHYELDADDFKPMLVDNVLIADYETGATAANATIKVTNVRKGDLIISKTVETYDGGTVDLSKEFEMKVTFKKGTETWAPAEADQVTYKIGATGTAQPFPSDGVIKLKHGGTATISNLPAGITYTVVEQNLSAGYTQIAPTSAATGTIVGDSAQRVDFTNQYSTSSVSATIPVTKILSVPSGLTGPGSIKEAYTFTLSAVTEGAPMPEAGGETVKNPDDNGGTANFGAITFYAPGTYKYKITESGTVAGVTNDSAATTGKEVTVTVEDNGNGTLSATVTSGSRITQFTNTYSVSPVVLAEGKISVNKNLTGTNLSAGAFNFEIKASEDTPNAPLPAVTTVTNNARGVAAFGEITYSKPGSYKYAISEIDGGLSGYTYDTHTETVVITVKDNGDGTLSVIAEYDPNGAVFNNTYSAKGSVVLKGTKSVTGTGLRSEQFIFNLIDKDNNILSTAKNDATGAFAFGALNYTEKDAGKTFTYTIVEVNDGQGGYAYDSKVCEVTVTVKDNGDGTLSAVATYTPDASFNNTYSAFGSVTFTGTKTVTGGTLESGQFTFNLLDQAGNVIGQATNAADGSFAFAPVSYTIADAGKTFNYSIVEVNDGQGGYTYDTKVCKISVNVTDLGDGVLKTDVAYEGDASFVNSYATSSTEVVLTAKKTLSGRKLADGEFSFTVSQGDNVIATGKNDVNGNITFSAIPLTKAGTYRFTVAEVIGSKEGVTYDKKTYTYVVVVEDVNGKLTVKDVSIDGATEVVFSNTYKTTPPPESPNTGDNTNLGLWLALMCLGAAGFTGSVLFGRRKRQRK